MIGRNLKCACRFIARKKATHLRRFQGDDLLAPLTDQMMMGFLRHPLTDGWRGQMRLFAIQGRENGLSRRTDCTPFRGDGRPLPGSDPFSMADGSLDQQALIGILLVGPAALLS